MFQMINPVLWRIIHRVQLLKHVFSLDAEKCHLCSKDFKINAGIEDPAVIKQILSHLGLMHPAPWPVREPPAQLRVATIFDNKFLIRNDQFTTEEIK